MNCQTFIFPNGRREYKRRDPSLTERSGRLWPQSMGVKLRDVPPNGLTFSKDEYNRHKAIYFAIMKLRQFGPNYMEDGILYAGVRVCLIEEGDDPATCGGTTPTRRDVAPMVGFEPRVVAAGAPPNPRFERIDGQTPPRGAGKSDPQLRIDSPRDGAVVAPGETLQVAVSSPNRTRFDAIVIVMEDLPAGDYGAIPASLPARFAIESRGVLVTGQHKSDVSRAKASLSGVEMR